MKAEDWSRVRDLLEQASGMPISARRALLDSLPPEEESYRREVERLLAVESVCSGFLETPIGNVRDTLPRMGYERDWVGERVGSFRIERVLASGGMGIVFEAVQDEPRRKVALKMMRMGLGSISAERRFRYEAELLGRLHHPGIAQVYEAGVLEEEGEVGRTPWFALEYVEGAEPLSRWARNRNVTIDARLRLFQQVLEAVQHGHQRGVIHRDLKPANVLVDPQGRVKIIDFGVGRRIDASFEHSLELTREGELVGTLRYMSPEQLGGRPAEVDVRSDVYSLGVLLFELLCERHPYHLEGLSIPEMARVLREEEPVRPSSLKTGLAEDLDWIVARAMAKEPERRYPSASAFASDLERFLRQEPVQATPPSYGYTMRKFVARHRLWVMAGAIVACAILLGLAGLGLGLKRALDAEEAAQFERERAVVQAAQSDEMLAFLVDSLASPSPSEGGRDLSMVEFLDQAGRNIDGRFQDRTEMRGWLHLVIGRSYASLGEQEPAEKHLTAAASLLDVDSVDWQRRFESLSDLTSLYVERGRYDQARESLEAERRLLEDEGDSQSEHQLRLLAQEARLAISMGDYEEGEARLREALSEYERAGIQDEDVLVTQSYLGGLLQESGRLEEAEQVYRKALEGWVQERGEEHPQSIRVRNNLALALHGQGKTEDVVQELEKLVAISRRVLGPEHPDTITALSNLGAIHYRSNRKDLAAPYMREALELLERTTQSDDPFLLGAKGNVGALELDLGNLDVAEPLLREVHDRRVEALGPDHDRTLRSFYELCRVATLRGDFESACEMYDEGYWRTKDALGEIHELFSIFELGLARSLWRAGDVEGAESVALEALDGFRAGRRSSSDADRQAQFQALVDQIQSDA